MKNANDDSYSRGSITFVLSFEELAMSLGITGDQVKEICYSNEHEIVTRMRGSAEESIREISYDEGFSSLSENIPPFCEIQSYEDQFPTRINLVD